MLTFPSSLALLALASVKVVTATDSILSAYTAPGEFPTSVYASYWNNPTATSAQPQPVISDPVTNTIFPANLTDPANFPKNDTVDPHPLPLPQEPSQLLQQALSQIKSIANNPALYGDTCAQCQASLSIGKMLVLAAPEQGPLLAEAVCVYFNFSTTCYDEYSRLALGSVFSQVVALGDMGGYDGQLLCAAQLNLCPMPPTLPLDLTSWFAKPKPNPLPPPKQPSGERLKVFHVSDIHIDPRYATGYEANCSQYLCCRENAHNTASPGQVLLPASRYGAYQCDTSFSLLLAAMEAIPQVTETLGTGFDFSLFTGDITAHDSDNQYSRAYVEYCEVTVYNLLKQFLGPAPVYATLGNHDTYIQFQMIPYALGGFVLGNQFNWLYDHVSTMWYYEGWLPAASVEYARTHYAAYTVKRPDGLRIISLDTDICTLNYFSYINASDPDPFGVLRFLTDELQDAEDAGDRVWIVGHVLSGWEASQSQFNPSDLWESVDRYSPHVIANVFFGHTHEDQLSIFYANNATNISAETALAVQWVMPSLTPLTNLNSGFRMYEVDSGTFDILDAYTWISRVDEFPGLDGQTEVGPTYVLEYSTREAYGQNITWGANDPLNATWWHLVTEQMEYNPSLVETFNTYQSKSSVMGLNCTGECIPSKICYLRSASSSISYARCNQSFTSTQ
ncbi:sphingomyelin phosphodiesterase [Boletus edulis BED1]|uniref:Sphingomyelin phosphodiesterase n=1 Tax=Boletus edulis BED1 TaxID=1328754 RepID=A0AAD4BLH6_BOLED|nr:sphingomyelin phosphodiesterase [Boletus edulis BED1]